MAVALGAEQDLHNKATENTLSCLSDNQGQGVVMQQRRLHDNRAMLSRKAPGLARRLPTSCMNCHDIACAEEVELRGELLLCVTRKQPLVNLLKPGQIADLVAKHEKPRLVCVVWICRVRLGKLGTLGTRLTAGQGRSKSERAPVRLCRYTALGLCRYTALG
jgi:hypothetical protein